MNMFKRIVAKTPAAYLAAIAEPRRTDMRALDRLIRKAAPSMKPHIAYGMLGYGKFHYRTKSGREGDWAVIGLASQKNYISVYVCSVKDGKYVAERHKKDFPKASIGRSCIRFKRLADIDPAKLTAVIREAVKYGPGFAVNE